jgi:hypothetical protein
MKLPSLSLLYRALTGACVRFPLTILSAVAFTGSIMLIIEKMKEKGDVFVPKLMMMGLLGMSLFTALTVFSEARGWAGTWKHWVLQLAGVGMIILCFFITGDPNARSFALIDVPRYLAFLLTAHLMVAVGPYLNRLPVADFWEYNKQIFAAIILGVVYTFILWAGLSLAILAVDQLFGLHVNYKVYPNLLALLAGIFNTVFFLSQVPQSFTFGTPENSYNVVFKSLCTYILIPIVGLYFLILYAYAGKILSTWTLPHGWVSSLVLGFSVAGIFTYLLNYMLPEFSKEGVSAFYKRWFWWVLLPLTALLFVAINKRIGDFGITEQRYWVLFLGIWLSVNALYFIFAKKDNIKFIPVSLAAIGLISVLGPWSAFETTRVSQTGRLKTLLEKNGRLVDGKAQKSTVPVSKEDKLNIRGIMQFLYARNGLYDVEGWFPEPADSLFNNGLFSLTTDRKIAKWLGGAGDRGSSLSVNSSQDAGYIDVRGFTKLYNLNSSGGKSDSERYFDISPGNKGVTLFEKQSGKAIDLETFDLSPYFKTWYEKSENGLYELMKGEQQLDLKGRKINIRIIVKRAGFNIEADKILLSDLEAVILSTDR